METNQNLEQLFLENVPKLVKYIIKKNHSAIKFFGSYEDMEQSLLCKVWNVLYKYDENKGKLSTFVVTVCQNAIRKQIHDIKQEKRKVNYNAISLDYIYPEGFKLTDFISNDIDFNQVVLENLMFERALSLLIPESYDYYIKGLKQVEIADANGCSRMVVSRKINNNIKQIKKVINKEFEL